MVAYGTISSHFPPAYLGAGAQENMQLTFIILQIKLSIPGLVMLEAEYLAFELLTLMSARFGTSYVAAQSILLAGTTIFYQLAFAFSIASSTRVANFLGAAMGDAAKISARTGFMAAIVVGIFNSCALFSVRKQFARLYTADAEIISLVVHVMPLTAAFQLFDSLACLGSGLLRGQGLLLCALCITQLEILMVPC